MSPHLVLPITLMTSVLPLGIDRLISETSLSESKPVASLKNPAASAPPMFKVNQIGTCASLSLAGIPVVPFVSSPDYSVTAEPSPPLNWLNLKITNSAGFTGAIPISQMTWPASITSGGLVSASHLT